MFLKKVSKNIRQQIDCVFLILIFLFCSSSFAQTTDGLVGWWKLSGDANDYSGYGNNGIVSGAQFISSDRGTVIDFDGVNDYVDIPVATFDTITNATTGTDKVTISLWQYGDNISPDDDLHHFLFHGKSGSSVFLPCYMLSSAGKIQFNNYGSSNISKTPTLATEYNGQWNHYAYTFDGTADEMKIYQNGQLWLSAAGKTQSLKQTIDGFRLGASSILNGIAVQQFYSGMLDDFRVYNRVLSIEEVQMFCTDTPNECFNALPVVTINNYSLISGNRYQMNVTVQDDGKPYTISCDPCNPGTGQSVGLTYQWSVADSSQSPFVTFEPNSETESPIVTFSRSGSYELVLQVWDDQYGSSPDTGDCGGKTAMDQITLDIVRSDDCGDIIRRGLKWPADVSGQSMVPDCRIDNYDLLYLLNHWLQAVPVGQDIIGPSGEPDGKMDMHDFVEIGAHWMGCYNPQSDPFTDPYDGMKVSSPNNRIEIAFTFANMIDANDLAFWSVHYDSRIVMDKSQLGYTLDSGPFDRNFRVIDVNHTSHDSTWNPPYGERSSIRDHYNQMVVTLADSSNRRVIFTFRAYDEGAAFKTTFPEQPSLDAFTINSENTEFRFTEDHWAWVTTSAQGSYSKKRISALGSNCERPLTLASNDETMYMSIAEAAMDNYARMRLKQHATKQYTIVSQLHSAVTADTPFNTPWRVLMIADQPGDLLENNFIILNLNEPCQLADTSWIKPGKVLRDGLISTVNGKACVDFASRFGIEYILYDGKWYCDSRSDLTASPLIVNPRFDLDLQEVIAYAHSKGVDVWLYVNSNHLKLTDPNLDDILRTYHEWGVAGIKYGFIDTGSQYWTNWWHDAIRKAADYHFMINVHDEYRLTGNERTYPHFMTAEGIGGNEVNPAAVRTLIYPFTRFICGPADFTFCWWSTTKLTNSWPHQMAATIVYYSPIQHVFWYDSPSQFTGDEPYLFFFKKLKTVWDQTRVIQGRIGEYITVARRNGNEWFVGTMNAVQQRQLNIPLDFLTPGINYTAYIYRDTDPSATTVQQVTDEQMTVTSETIVTADMASNGGHAMMIVLQD